MFQQRLTNLLLACLFMGIMACDGPSPENKATEAALLTTTHNLSPAFWDYAVSTNMLQIELGRLAAQKGTTQQLKDLGRKTEKFHSDAVIHLKKLGDGHNAIQIPDSLGSADRMMVKEFAVLEGSEFDTRYRDHIIISHKAQLSRYEEAMQKADSPGLRQWLTDMQLHMRKQLQEVELADSNQAVTDTIL